MPCRAVVRENSVCLGVYELTHNNKTVSLRTINAVQQLSLYPELIASVLYRATGSHVGSALYSRCSSCVRVFCLHFCSAAHARLPGVFRVQRASDHRGVQLWTSTPLGVAYQILTL